MKNTRQSSKKPKPSSSQPDIESDARELQGLKQLPSGEIGPWSERYIALYRTLESAIAACDGIQHMPAEMIDGVLEKQIRTAVQTACQLCGTAVLRMAGHVELAR